MGRLRCLWVVVIATVAFSGSLLVTRCVSSEPYCKEKEGTRLALSYLRGRIERYREVTGGLPGSLSQMQAYFTGTMGQHWGPHMERISCREGNAHESSVLDGTGGWYYNRETGELRVNLDRPLARYFKDYYLLDRNERPSSW